MKSIQSGPWQMPAIYILLFIFCLVGGPLGCAAFEKLKNSYSLEMPDSHKVTVNQEAWVKTTEGEAVKTPPGTPIEVKDSPVLIEKPGHVGVLVLPPGVTPSQADLILRPIPSWAGEATKQYADKLISELLLEIYDVQALLSKGQSTEALQKARALRSKHPRISYLKFLEASCLVVLGRSNQAKDLLSSALGEHPDNESAKSLYRSLAGERGPVK